MALDKHKSFQPERDLIYIFSFYTKFPLIEKENYALEYKFKPFKMHKRVTLNDVYFYVFYSTNENIDNIKYIFLKHC